MIRLDYGAQGLVQAGVRETATLENDGDNTTPHSFGWCSGHAWKVLGGLGRSIIACSWRRKRPDAPMAVEIFGEADQKHGDLEGEDNSAFVRATLLKRLKRKHVTFCQFVALEQDVHPRRRGSMHTSCSHFFVSLSLLLRQCILYEADLLLHAPLYSS